MRAFLGFGLSIDTFRRNKLRTFLGVVGTGVGVSMIIGILAVGDGLRVFILREMERAGELNVVKVRLGDWVEAETWDPKTTRLTMDDLVAIQRYCPNVKTVSPETDRQWMWASSEGVFTISEILGVSPAYTDAYAWRVQAGRFISADDMKTGAKVCVIGTELWTRLYRRGDAIGREIVLGAERLRIVGVMAEKSDTLGLQGYGRRAFLPLTTMQQRFTGKQHIDVIRAQAHSFEVVDQAGAEIRRVLRHTHDGQDWMFDFWTPTSSVRETKQTAAVLTSVLVCIAGITLLVGAIGIMNLMLVSVTERTSEIGLRKAVGATRLDILLQFLAEAALIGLMGGLIGVLVGVAIGHGMAMGITAFLHSTFISKVVREMFKDVIWPAVISWKASGISALVSLVIGVFFGIYPAYRASRLTPVDALRYE
ncbi:FtsX-like permease family protein [Candidatus Poribacteria bacterium]|jgi:putative ABC transport system permease protein|nr:FtsX-like permease family protein [Candidatus Poribacteria bacterium]MBT5537234.1 FtsX-like permease family protein [Candidatus Poribacteria bacterium]MBT5711029.1 FtsX-like permease family protein [Candidatus Poribacteria bacterium]MBT7100596.1 FtsX-like permease family protein [Candidatus Poribacteria bacterium]MBT7806259.1 FtsX-like permease family protein [Candidatus Poribacteria bacterium]